MHQTLVSTSVLSSHLEHDWLVVDCRFSLDDPNQGETAFGEAHIPGSVYAQLDRDLSGPIVPGISGRHPLPDPSVIASLLRVWGLEVGKQVVAYDQGPGGMAARLWWLLNWMGHKDVAILEGGWEKWCLEGRPTTSEISTPVPSTSHWKANSGLILDASQVDKVRKDASWVLIDSRAASRYAGIEEPIDPVAGHIAGAVNRPWMDNLQIDGTWKPEDVLMEQFVALTGEKGDKQIAFYCGSGVTACHNILAYRHAGLGSSLLYPGSWSEWLHRY